MTNSLRFFSVFAPSRPEPLHAPLVDPNADTVGLHQQVRHVAQRGISGGISAWTCVNALAEIIELIPIQDADFTIHEIRAILENEYDPLEAMEKLSDGSLAAHLQAEHFPGNATICIAAE